MERKYFNFSDVLGYGWAVMKANFWFFVGVILVFAATGIMAGAYVPVFTNTPKNPPVPLAFSFPAINLVLGGIILWIASEFANSTMLVAVLPAFTLFTVLLFLSLSVRALKSYK